MVSVGETRDERLGKDPFELAHHPTLTLPLEGEGICHAPSKANPLNGREQVIIYSQTWAAMDMALRAAG